jgi:hypothetical protein
MLKSVGSGASGGGGITALTGDVTGSGTGSVATSVVQVNGAVVPTSAAYLASNSSKQLIAATAPVTSIVFSTGLTGGTISSTGTVTIDPTQSVAYSVAQNIGVALAANTSGDGLILADPTAATAANQRYSPRLNLQGQGWATTPVASQPVNWIIENQPIQGAANPSSILAFSSSVNGGAYTLNGQIGSGSNGAWNFFGPVIASNFRATGATVPTNGIYMSTANWLSFASNSTFRGSFDVNGNFTTIYGRGDLSKSVQVPVTGFSITIANNTRTLILDPAGTLASGTIALPVTPFDGMEIEVSSSQIVTALTTTSTQTIKNAPTSLAAGIGFKYIYHLANTTWYRKY